MEMNLCRGVVVFSALSSPVVLLKLVVAAVMVVGGAAAAAAAAIAVFCIPTTFPFFSVPGPVRSLCKRCRWYISFL